MRINGNDVMKLFQKAEQNHQVNFLACCPHCHSMDIEEIEDKNEYICNECGKKFNDPSAIAVFQSFQQLRDYMKEKNDLEY